MADDDVEILYITDGDQKDEDEVQRHETGWKYAGPSGHGRWTKKGRKEENQ